MIYKSDFERCKLLNSNLKDNTKYKIYKIRWEKEPYFINMKNTQAK